MPNHCNDDICRKMERGGSAEPNELYPSSATSNTLESPQCNVSTPKNVSLDQRILKHNRKESTLPGCRR